jgi:SAM-dependent methyltransferase
VMNISDSNLVFCAGDTRGALFDTGNAVKRVCNGSDSYPQNIYNAYLAYNLAAYGIVNTTYSPENRTFTHKKHTISYPHEWPPSLFKDVVLFHLDLLIHLDRYGLTLKDALPENILLDGVRPVFVDFLSLMRVDELGGLGWLMSGATMGTDPRLRVLQLMFVPYMLLPLLLYTRKDFDGGRRLLAECFCNNTVGVIATWDLVSELFLSERLLNLFRQLVTGASHITLFPQFNELRNLCSEPAMPWYVRLERLYAAVEACDVTPSSSGYESYYADKGELFGIANFNTWGEKQRNVHRVLSEERPATVLDIGANTGWFSKLACSLGAAVIATDVDIRSINILYKEARLCRLPLTPLCLSFDDFTIEHFSLNEHGLQHQFPLHMAATKRLRSDMVLCLGLLHHLILGMGKTVQEIFHILSQLAQSVLVLEYIEPEDELIKSEPSFFKHLAEAGISYCEDTVLIEGKKHFNSVQVLDSHPGTRRLLVFKK